jgi:integrase/recombinase XerD
LNENRIYFRTYFFNAHKTPMKVTAILKGKPDKLGKQSVYIRINDGDLRVFKAAKIKVKKADWSDKGLVKQQNPDAALYNSLIKKLIHESEANFADTYHKPVKKKDEDFFAYYERSLKAFARSRKMHTVKGYQRDIAKLKSFRSSFRLSEINLEFLQKYQDFLNEQGLETNTVWSYFKFLKMMIHKAKKEELIDKNPFDQFDKPAYKDRMKTFLTEQELETVDRFALHPKTSEQLRFSANWFLIGCYTGLRYSDQNSFSKAKNIVGDRFIKETDKTGSIVSMPVSDRLKKLFERVGYSNLNISNQRYNTNLKSIVSKCKIEKKVSAHIARHTFATLCASKGVSIEVCAKLLGHSSTKITSIYYKIMNVRIDDEVSRIHL